MSLTNLRASLPGFTGDAKRDYEALKSALTSYLLALEAKGALSIGEANITASNGIKFPATQNPSSDANTLDDYKEVTAQAITVTSSTGTITTVGTATITYTKTGRDVSWQADITITTNGTGSGLIGFTFPFTVVGGAPIYGSTDGFIGLAGYIVGTSAAFAFYDGTYPGSDGARFFVGGTAKV